MNCRQSCSALWSLPSCNRSQLAAASWDLLHEGKLHKAEQLCRQFMQQNPQHIDGMRILAEIAVRNGVLEDAEFLLESAVAFDAYHRQARIDYVQVLSKRQRFQKAFWKR